MGLLLPVVIVWVCLLGFVCGLFGFVLLIDWFGVYYGFVWVVCVWCLLLLLVIWFVVVSRVEMLACYLLLFVALLPACRCVTV